MTDPVWIECQQTGCPNGIGVWHKHARNFEDRYRCPEHDVAEVPC